MISPKNKCIFSVAFEREAQFIAGRYCKYSRNLPQSPWAVELDGPKNIENSVNFNHNFIVKFRFRKKLV